MAFVEKACPECGEVLAVNRLRYHRRDEHGVPLNVRRPANSKDDDQPTDEPPRERPRGRHVAGGMPAPLSVQAQLELVYNLVGDLVRAPAPIASGAVKMQAHACAKADEQLLRRWPKLYEAIEKGAVAGDILAVFMAHYPILMAVREEIDIRRREAMIREGQGGYEEPVAA